MANPLEKLLRAGEGRILRRLQQVVKAVGALEEDYEHLTDEELRGETAELRARYEAGETLDQLMPEAFAAVREAAKRTLGQRAYDVQIMGGAALHLGNIAEMKTGEGKTLTGAKQFLEGVGHGVSPSSGFGVRLQRRRCCPDAWPQAYLPMLSTRDLGVRWVWRRRRGVRHTRETVLPLHSGYAYTR